MPHQCTNCNATFPDGSKEMLSGCPHCGGNTFQYLPKGADTETDQKPQEEPPEPPIDEDSVTGRMTRAASTVREYVSSREEQSRRVPDEHPHSSETDTRDSDTPTPTDSQEHPSTEQPERPTARTSDEATSESHEDRAQASARTDVADLSELSSPGERSEPLGGGVLSDRDSRNAGEDPSTDRSPPQEGRVVDDPDTATSADLETLRDELNDQFESIRILEPGQYELNLMELYDREEHIVALREDGKYVIEVPETWRNAADSE